MKTTKPYLQTLVWGNLFNSMLLLIICNVLPFNYKSAVCIFVYGTGGFLFKSALFFLPYLFLPKAVEKKSILFQLMLVWLPFVFFVLWYYMIYLFQIESLYPDVEFGYTGRLHHFIVQLFSALTVCIVMSVKEMMRVIAYRKLPNKTFTACA